MSQNNNSRKMIIDCPSCSQRFSEDMPVITTVNAATFSQMIAPHEKVIRCPNAKCCQPMTFALTGAQVNWSAVLITRDVAEQMSGSPIIPASPLALLH